MILRHEYPDIDQARLSALCGPMDAHLRAMEAALGVEVQRRAAFFRIEGPAPQARLALALLEEWYQASATHFDTARAQDLLRQATNKAGRLERRRQKDEPAKTHPSVTGLVDDGEPILHTRRAGLGGRSLNQRHYLKNMLTHDITFAIGPAGTGKTFLAVACAVDALERQAVQRIVLTRPAVEAGERLGYLPGDVSQKVDPYLRPLHDALFDLMGMDKVARSFEKGLIEVAPLAFMRGRTLNNAFVILDEAQNTTPEQMKMFLTRLGFGSRCVVTGDTTQVDLPRGQTSGLIDAERVLRRVPGMAFSRLGAQDVVRHPMVAHIVDAYDEDRRAPHPLHQISGE